MSWPLIATAISAKSTQSTITRLITNNVVKHSNMGNLSTHNSIITNPVKSTFSAYLTEDEENALRASFEGHLDIKGALNAPSLALVGDEDLENVDTFLHFVVKLMRNNRTARVTLDAITSQDKARDYFTLY